MRFGVNTLIWTANFGPQHLDLFPRLKEGGFDGVEISLFNPAGFDTASTRRRLEENGLGVTMCSVLPGVSLLTEDSGERQRAQQHIVDCARTLAELGGELLIGPLFSPVGYLPGRRRTPDEWQRAVEAYQELGPVLQTHGVHLALEPLNRFETYFLNTAADAVRLCDEVGHPHIGVMFDTFHANIEEKSVGEALHSVGRHLKHVHTCENDRGTPGTGHVDWPIVFAALQSMGYDGWLTIESFGFAIPELIGAAAIWRDLAGTPEEIAFEGVKFLRGMTGQTQPRAAAL